MIFTMRENSAQRAHTELRRSAPGMHAIGPAPRAANTGSTDRICGARAVAASQAGELAPDRGMGRGRREAKLTKSEHQ